jgi:WD40 repeat protein
MLFLPDGALVTSGADGTLRVWNITEKSISSKELIGHRDAVDSLAYNPQQPHLVASAGADKSVRVWDTKYVQIIFCRF